MQELVSNPFDEAPELTAANPLGKVPTLVLDNGDSDTASMLDVSAKLDGIAALWQIGEQDAAVQALQDLLDHRTEDALDRALLEARLPAALLERVRASLPESPPEK